MGERLICIQEVGGSIPPGSTIVESAVAKKNYYSMFSSGLKRNVETGTLSLIFKNL
jgi:hypothetical protein